MSTSKPSWALAADAVVIVAGGGGDRYAGLPPHKDSKGSPDGGNHVYADGSVSWKNYKDMYKLHSWWPASRVCYWYQDIAGLDPDLQRSVDRLKAN